MPELPDIDLYVHALRVRILGQRLLAARIGNPFVLRSVTPPLSAALNLRARTVERLGKRVAIGFDDDYWMIVHLMIAGRLQWQDNTPALKAKARLAALDFESGSLLLTESATRKRASLHLVQGTEAKEAHRPDGVEPLSCTAAQFSAQLEAENRTLKRILTDPRRFSGIGNAYSDEILHAARLSPVALTSRLNSQDKCRLYDATRKVLAHWSDALRAETGEDFPARVTAFKKEMAVHGRFGQPCRDCATRIERIRYKSRETNYCPGCQTQGKVLADRSLSRLLKDSWPAATDNG